MGIHFEQIGLEERASIWTLKCLGHSMRSIARALGRAPSTISRELRANANEEDDFTARVRKAQYLSECRRSVARRRTWLKSIVIQDFVEQKLASLRSGS
jgi:IS30 family transposase